MNYFSFILELLAAAEIDADQQEWRAAERSAAIADLFKLGEFGRDQCQAA